ncbi:hypothetical protein HYY75_06010, partial [bacterium]|nr:hypothetical protein [bacterium]
MPLKNAVVIANPKAGKTNPNSVLQAVCFLSKYLETRLLWTKGPGDSKKLAMKFGGDPDTLVVVSGGDGSINEAVNGIPNGGVLGILPNGTANVAAKEFGIPLKTAMAAKLLLTGTVRKIDIGSIFNRKFLLMAGLGFDAQVASTVSPTMKRFFGQYSYHFEVARRYFFYVPPKIILSVEGAAPVMGAFAIVSNVRRYGGDLFFSPNARPTDCLLDVLFFRDLSFRSFSKGVLAAWARREIPDEI